MIMIGVLLTEIEKYTDRYEFNFQFWGADNNNVFISKGGIEMAHFGGEATIEDVLARTLNWLYRVNRVPNDKRIFNINPNF